MTSKELHALWDASARMAEATEGMPRCSRCFGVVFEDGDGNQLLHTWECRPTRDLGDWAPEAT